MVLLRHSLILLVLLLLPQAHAAGVARPAGFYQGSSPVDSRSSEARDAATRAALGDVLARMTGDVSVSLNAASEALLSNAPRYVRSYRYAEDNVELRPGERETRQRLIVDFDPTALVQAAKQAGLPLWDDRRPTTMTWVVGPTDQGPRHVYGRERIEERLPGLVEAARRRGLPLVYPLMDEQDQAAVSSFDIIGEDYERLAQAALRYQTRHMLLVRIESRDGLWYALWSFLQPDQEPRRWRTVGDEPNVALASGFDEYADELASRYVTRVAAGWVQSARLRVVGLNALADYARVLNLLETTSLIETVQPRELMGDEVVFLVDFEGEVSDLQRSLAVAGFLREEAAAAAGTLLGQDAQPAAGDSASGGSGLSFYAVSQRRELRYRYAQ